MKFIVPTKIVRISKILSQHLDIIFSIMAIIIPIIIIISRSNSILVNSSYFFILIPVFGALIYLLWRRRDRGEFSIKISLEKFKLRKAFKFSLIIFSIIFIFCIFQESFEGISPYRPSSFFILQIILYLPLILQIIINEELKSKWFTSLIWIQIMLIGILNLWSLRAIFPGEMWYDPWFHRWYTENMISSGSLINLSADLRPYNKMPIMHLLIGSGMIIYNANWDFTSFLVIDCVMMIIFVLFIYLIAYIITHSKLISLFASVLVTSADLIISNIIITYPNLMGITFCCVILYLILKRGSMSKNDQPIATLIIITGFIVLVLIHPMAAITMGFIIFALYLVQRGNTSRSTNTVQLVTIFLLFLFIIIVLSFWEYMTGYLTEFSNLIKFGFLRERFGGVPSDDLLVYLVITSTLNQLINRAGEFLLVVFSFFGFLVAIRKQKWLMVGITGSGISLLAIGGIGLIFNLRNFENRFFLSAQVLLIISSIFGIANFCSFFKKKNFRPVVFGSLLLLTIGLLLTSSISSPDNELYRGEQSRFYLLESEMTGIASYNSRNVGNLITDEHSYVYYNFITGYRDFENQSLVPFNEIILKGNISSHGNLLIRTYILENPYKSGPALLRATLGLDAFMFDPSFDNYYSNGKVIIYRY